MNECSRTITFILISLISNILSRAFFPCAGRIFILLHFLHQPRFPPSSHLPHLRAPVNPICSWQSHNSFLFQTFSFFYETNYERYEQGTSKSGLEHKERCCYVAFRPFGDCSVEKVIQIFFSHKIKAVVVMAVEVCTIEVAMIIWIALSLKIIRNLTMVIRVIIS